jgi:hypothetical protein
MFLVFSLVLLFVALGILASVYSIFFPFMQNLWTANNYHRAYYGAVSAVERAELVLRYRWPWFEWSGWFLWSSPYGPVSDYSTGLLPGDQEWLWWNINSRTTKIPFLGMGNTEPMLSAVDSKDYNQLWYVNLETFLLYYDSTTATDLYYTWPIAFAFFTGGWITWTLRLPPKIYSSFWLWSWWPLDANLCDTTDIDTCDINGDQIYNDVAVAWSMLWFHMGNDFTIYPTEGIDYSQTPPWILPFRDNFIRESIINSGGLIDFTYGYTPLAGVNGQDVDKHNVVSFDTSVSVDEFYEILGDWNNYSWLRLVFGAADLFRAIHGSIYPYLEYQFTFPDDHPISDRFFTIQWNGRAWEYDVTIVIKKPTVQWSIGGDFTVNL